MFGVQTAAAYLEGRQAVLVVVGLQLSVRDISVGHSGLSGQHCSGIAAPPLLLL